MKKNIIILFFFAQVLIFTQTQTSWYVSTTSSGNGSGNSWANKKIYSTFNWSNVTPGDVVYMDGGADSLVYNINQYGVNSHGTAALPILITKGVDASHNGKVVFRSTSTNYIGMSLSNISYTIFDNLKWKGGLSATGENWIVDFGGNTQSVTFQYCEFELNYSCGIGTNSEQTSNNIKFLHCNIYNWLDTGTNSSSDMLWLGGQNHTNWEIAYCNIINKNPKTGATPSSAHRDLVQFSWGFGGAGGTTKIHHNFFDDRSAGAAGACIEAYDVGGNWEIYNNIWKSNSTGANGSGDFSLISMSIPRSAGAVWGIRTWFSSMKLYNNTFYATTSHVSPLFLIGFSSVDVRNNIFYAPSLGSGSIYLATDLYTQNHSMTWDYNQYSNNAHSNIMAGYGDTGVGIADGASTYTWAQWRAAGYDLHSTYNTDTPDFINPTSLEATGYGLQAGSDGINDGTTIAFVTNDYSGINRPQGTAYDFGAFEYIENIIDTTAPNLQGAILNNSTQLVINFSETLNSATAQNKSNYSITNGIVVSSAVLSGTQVTLTTSAHVSGAYTVTVNNVTDLAGNVISPNNNTVNYNYAAADVTPPQVVSAALTNSTTLVVNFSETLNSTTAQNKSNYSITNGISVSSVVLSGTQVTLTTSAHVSGAYVVTVNNVIDLAGNIINPNNNTASYNYTSEDVTPPQVVSAAIIDSVSLNVYFSENLEPASAQNISNYIIDGISVTNAILNSNVVRLSTSIHTNGSYQVTVNNVTDIEGNLISSQNNSYVYEYSNSNTGMLRLNIFQARASHWYLDYSPNKAADGINAGESRWGGAISMPDTLEFILDDIQILNTIKLTFYNWNLGRIYNYSILVSSDYIMWNQIRTNIPSQPQEWSIEEVGPIEARYIKIIFLSNNQGGLYAGLWEAEFWGQLKLISDTKEGEFIPLEFSLEQNYPNPFNPSTKIRWRTALSSYNTLKVYDVLGNEVAILVDEFKPSGSYEVEFESENLASGVYVYRLQTTEFTETKKMILLR